MFTHHNEEYETILRRGESNLLSGCVLRLAVARGGSTLRTTQEKRPGLWKVLHGSKTHRCGFRLPALPVQLPGDNSRSGTPPSSSRIDRHVRGLPGLRQRIPLRLAGDEGDYLIVRAARVRSLACHETGCVKPSAPAPLQQSAF